MTSDRLRSAALPAVAVSLCSFVLLVQADIALHKGFWLDEGFEIVRTCGQSFVGLLRDGAYECSPAPLYWLAQTAVVRSIDAVGLALRVQYRAISLGASTLAVLFLTLGLGRRVGLRAAVVACSALIADPGFHYYATQNRAYMTWALVTTALVFAAARATDSGRPPRAWLPALLGAGGLVSLTALPGCLQALSAFAACVLVRRWLDPSAGPWRRAVTALALGGLALLALDVRYWASSPCRAYTPGGDLDIALSADRWSLIRRGLTVLWPEATGPWMAPVYAALVAGALTPLVLGRRRSTLTDTERRAFALAVIALTQIAPAIPVGLGLAHGHYLFHPRMFIFAMVPRCMLTGLGFWLIASSIAKRVSAERAQRWVSLAGVAVALIAATVGVRFTLQWARAWAFPLPPVGQIDCEPLRSAELHVLERPQPGAFAFTPNFLVRLGRALDACAYAPAPPPAARYLLALDATTQADWFRIVDHAPPGFEPMRVCQAPVVLRDGRRVGLEEVSRRR